MEIIYVLLPLSLLLATCGLAAYVWCVTTRQFDDPDKGSLTPLFEDETPNQISQESRKTSETNEELPAKVRPS